MAQSDFPLLTPTDALISEFFAGLETALNAEATFQVKGIQTPIKSGTQEFKELSKSGAQIIHHALIRQGNISIIYNASQIIQADGKVVPHPYYSFIRVSSPDNNPANTLTFPDILKIGGFIRENGLSPSLSASQEVGEGSQLLPTFYEMLQFRPPTKLPERINSSGSLQKNLMAEGAHLKTHINKSQRTSQTKHQHKRCGSPNNWRK
jgi:hypothetical protein